MLTVGQSEFLKGKLALFLKEKNKKSIPSMKNINEKKKPFQINIYFQIKFVFYSAPVLWVSGAQGRVLKDKGRTMFLLRLMEVGGTSSAPWAHGY